MKEMPWMDIPPLAKWLEFFNAHSVSINKQKKVKAFFSKVGLGKVKAQPDTTDKFTGWIKAYHAIDKQNEKLLTLRVGYLDLISSEGNKYLTNKYKNKYDLNYKPGEKTGLNYWIAKYTRRAHRKAEYIRKLMAFLKEGNALSRQKDEFMTYLFGKRNRAQTDLLGLQVGVMVEKLDPWHRGIEFSTIGQLDSGKWTIGGIEKTIFSQEFARWISDNSTTIPFLLWLEGREVVTGHFKDKEYGSGSVEIEGPGSVKYAGDSGVQIEKYYMLYPSGGLLYKWDENSTDSDPMDTSDAPSSSKLPKGYAYVWTKDDLIFVAPHIPLETYHSSLSSGKKVKCAGMIKIINGKVKYVTNDSGHYRPTGHHLRNFVEYLDSLHVLADDVIIQCYTGTIRPKYDLTQFIQAVV